MAFACLAIIVLLRKYRPTYPGFLISVIVGSVCVALLNLPIDTIGSKFGGIPSGLPKPALPAFSLDTAMRLFPSAFTIAFLAGIESLLSAVVADGMSGDRHLSNCELVAEGAGNIASVIFGGVPATGAIARTAANIRAGAYSSVAGMMHAVFLLLFMIFLAPLAAYVPLASLAAVLVMVAWNMSGFERIRLLMSAQAGDRLTMIVTFLLTVFVDLNTAIEVGVVMACLIFMHRMSISFAVENNVMLSDENKDERLDSPDFVGSLPEGVATFKISGPLFFGAASRLTDFFDNQPNPFRADDGRDGGHDFDRLYPKMPRARGEADCRECEKTAEKRFEVADCQIASEHVGRLGGFVPPRVGTGGNVRRSNGRQSRLIAHAFKIKTLGGGGRSPRFAVARRQRVDNVLLCPMPFADQL